MVKKTTKKKNRSATLEMDALPQGQGGSPRTRTKYKEHTQMNGQEEEKKLQKLRQNRTGRKQDCLFISFVVV